MWSAIRRRTRQKAKRQHVLIYSAASILWSAFVISALVRSFLHLPTTLHLSQRCRMSRMWPSYVPYNPPTLSGLDKKYRLFLYREAYPARPKDADKPRGRPALFIPGNAGSFGQVRSIASSAHHLFASGQGGTGAEEVDWWTVDFNEDFSAFHGQTMHEQAEYTNEVIKFLLKEYPKIKEVPILAHSMGGIVARLMMLKDNHPSNSVDTIITLSSPHAYPPVPLDSGVEQVYDQINSLWETSANSTLLISLSGGILDNQLSSEPASLLLARLWHGNSSLSAFTSGLPALWSGVDHLAMMWCDQLRERVARGVFQVEGKEKTLLDRRESWRRVLGIEQSSLDLPVDLSKPPFTVTLTEGPLFKTFAVAEAREDNDAFELLTDLSIGLDTSFGPPIDQEAQLRVNLCSSSDQESFLCRHVPPSAYELYPPSPPIDERDSSFFSFPNPEERYELPGKGLRRLRINLGQLRQHQIGQIFIERRQESDVGLIQAGWTQVAQTMHLTPSATRKVIVPMRREPDSTSPSMQVIASGMVSSLLAYDLAIIPSKQSNPSCQSKAAPLLKIQSLSTGDTQYYPSAIPGSHYTLTLHSTSPFMPSPSESRQGTKFTLLLDTCSKVSGVSVNINWRASIGLLLSRYRTMIGSLPYAVLLLVASFMWEEWDHGGFFPSLSSSITQQGVFILPILISVSALLSVFQVSAASFDLSHGSLPQWIQNMNFGISTSSLLFNSTLAFFFLTSAYGICLFASLLLDGLIGSFATIVRHTGISAGFRSIEPVKSDILRRPRTTLISTALLALMIWLAVPIQFVFLVLFLIQLYSAVMAQISAQEKEENWRTNRVNQQKLLLNVYFWLLPFNAPALLIWTRNLTRGYFGALGGPDHNILYISGFIAITMISSSGVTIQRCQSSVFSTVTIILMLAFSVYCLAYGIRYTHILFRLANLLTLWLAIMHYKDSISQRQSKRAIPASKEDEEVERELLVSKTDLHMTIPESVENINSLPESLVASLKTKQEGYTIEENGASKFQTVTNGNLSNKDALLEKYLDTLDEYFACKKKISDKITSGHFQLSKARMQLGRLTSLNQSWDARMKAKVKVKVRSDGQLLIERVETKVEEEGDLLMEKVESSALRRRRVASEDSLNKEADVSASNEKIKDDKKKPKEEKKVQAFDPLYQFAALPPPSLRQAQSSFLTALESLIGKQESTGLLQIQKQLDQLEEMICSIN